MFSFNIIEGGFFTNWKTKSGSIACLSTRLRRDGHILSISDGDASTQIVSAVIDYDHSGQSMVLFAEDTDIFTLMAGKHGRCRRSNAERSRKKGYHRFLQQSRRSMKYWKSTQSVNYIHHAWEAAATLRLRLEPQRLLPSTERAVHFHSLRVHIHDARRRNQIDEFW